MAEYCTRAWSCLHQASPYVPLHSLPHLTAPLPLPLRPTGFSFQVTPAKGKGRTSLSGLTPSKALLMEHESKMSMISPLASTSLFHTDIETGEWVWGGASGGCNMGAGWGKA